MLRGQKVCNRQHKLHQIFFFFFFLTDHVAYASTNKTNIVWIETDFFSFLFLPGSHASHVYTGAWVLCCFHGLIRTQTFRRTLTASVDSCTEIKIERPLSGVTNSGRVWRKVPKSKACSECRTLEEPYKVSPSSSGSWRHIKRWMRDFMHT